MSRQVILVADDDSAVRTSLAMLLKQHDFSILCANDPGEIIDIIQHKIVDLVLLDMNFSVKTTGEEGLLILKKIRSLSPDLPVVLMTAWGSIELAVAGMRAGATDFITKPWNNIHLVSSVQTILQLYPKVRSKELSINRQELDNQYDFENIIGQDPHFLSMLAMIGRISKTDATVLITGESGTGKEMIAEAIHNNSNRKAGQFVRVNLGGVPVTLFESEMFGHKRGAFTDAHHNRIGRFSLAQGGTIFLDEIGDLDKSSQVKLLHVLQNRSFERLGESKPISVDARVVCATNKDLNDMVARGAFREDLFYRINLIKIDLPPLRKRVGDIPILVNHFLEKLMKQYNIHAMTITQKALNWLCELTWAGNIRELKNLVERTVLMSVKEKLDADDFRQQLQTAAMKTTDGHLPAVGSMTLDEIEKDMILKAIEFHNGNMTRVAKSLGLSRGALYRRLEKFGISP